MGCALRHEISCAPDLELAAAIVAPHAACLGKDAGGINFTSNVRAALSQCDVLIDFSTPAAAIDAALLLYDTPCKAMVCGTTGFSDTDEQALAQAGEAITLVKSGNFSIGITLLEHLVSQAAAALPDDWDVGILDIHHRHKKDAPSGTAKMLSRAAEVGGKPVAPDQICALRQGGIIGEHKVFFSSPMETVSLDHTALDRAVFARGALTAAKWAAQQGKGLYTMQDVLGLSSDYI